MRMFTASVFWRCDSFVDPALPNPSRPVAAGFRRTRLAMITRTSGTSIALFSRASCRTTPSSTGTSGSRHHCSSAGGYVCLMARHPHSPHDRTRRPSANRSFWVPRNKWATSGSARSGMTICSCTPTLVLEEPDASFVGFGQKSPQPHR